METMEWIMRERVDLARPQGLRVWPEVLLIPGDSQAHRWCVAVYRSGDPVDLTGWAVTGYITRRRDDVLVPVTGTAEGCEASCVLPPACYVGTGEIYGVMQISKGSVRLSVSCGRWRLGPAPGDQVADPEDVIPSLQELLAEIDGMREATSAAHAASEEALAAAEEARQAIDALSRHAAPAIELQASGEVVAISDSAARPALSLVSQIVAVQSGTGDPSPDHVRPITGWDSLTLTRTGRNMLDPAALRQVQISTGETRWGVRYTQPGTYALSASVHGGDADYVYARVTDGSGEAVGDTMYLVAGSAVRSYAVTLEAGQTLTVWYVRDLDQATAAECMARTQVQVEMGSRTAYVYGQSAAITVALPETVYGGHIDWLTGLLTVTHGHIAAYAGEDVPEGWISSVGALTDGAQVVYPLATPYTIQLDPQTLDMLRGYNTLWCRTGSTEVGYVADTKTYVESHGGGGDADFAEYAAYAEYAERAGDAETVKNIDVVKTISQLTAEVETIRQINNFTYPGVDLSVKFSTEIAGYSSPWAWIKARIKAEDYSHLHVGDYIPFTTTNGRTFQAQIAGFDTYYQYGDKEIGHHIDFITRELWPDTFQMNPVNFNNGTSSDKKVPWIASNGYLYANSLAGQVPNNTTKPLEMVDVDYTAGGMYFYLPDDLKEVIVEKRVWAQTRFSDSGILTNDNSGAWVNMGKLWLPDEYEITGTRLMTTTGWFTGGYVQYPIFAHGMNRLKRSNGSRDGWWTSSASAGLSTSFVFVYSYGLVTVSNASGAYRAPFCFRVS